MGLSTSETLQKCRAKACENQPGSICSGAYSRSAEGLRQKLKVRSPFSAKLTKASAVLALLVNSRWESSTPHPASARAILWPKGSSPSWLSSALRPPSRAAAAQTLAGAPPTRGLKAGTSSKLHPTREGIISISASPMENKILSDIGLLPFCIQVCRKVRQCTVYTRRALCATASFIR